MSITRSDLPFAICKLCGAKILHATTESAKGDGKLVSVPLNAIAPVYRVTVVEGDRIRAERQRDTFVSHFATCSGIREGKRP